MRLANALALALVARSAAAHSFLQENIGGTVFVGPTSPHASAVLWNPAAAGLLKGFHLYMGGVARLDYTSTQRSPISTADGAPTPGGDRTFPSSQAVGFSPAGFIGLVTDAGTDRFTLGLAIYTPFAERIPGGDPAAAYHNDGGWLYATEITPSASFRFSSSLYAGISFTVLFSQAKLTFLRDKALDGCAAPPCGLERPENAERYSVTTDLLSGANGGLKLGILFRLADWWFGASVSALALLPTTTSDVIRSGTAEVVLAGETQPITGETTLAYRLPTVFQIGTRHQLLPEWELIINARWITYSITELYDVRLFGTAFRDSQVPERILRYRGFQDVVALEAGLENAPGTSPRLGVRARFDTSSLPPDRVAPGNIDAPTLTVAGGAELRLSRRWALVLGTAASFVLPVTVTDSAFSPPAQIACTASGYDLDTCAPVLRGQGISSAAGSYLRLRGDFTVGLSYDAW